MIYMTPGVLITGPVTGPFVSSFGILFLFEFLKKNGMTSRLLAKALTYNIRVFRRPADISYRRLKTPFS